MGDIVKQITTIAIQMINKLNRWVEAFMRNENPQSKYGEYTWTKKTYTLTGLVVIIRVPDTESILASSFEPLTKFIIHDSASS